jgi:(p)ppGpp synthase/HD superfamily hydrolase
MEHKDIHILGPFVRSALRFSLETHEVQQKQKRKGKDIPYITHPLTVGLILARAGASDEVIAAGILHDTIEDSVPEHKVTHVMLKEHFGEIVADAVQDVTEVRTTNVWKEVKQQALEHIKTISGPALWVKTADVISNVSEILDDHAHRGDAMFSHFAAPKADFIANYRAVIDALLLQWTRETPETSQNPMLVDLQTLATDLAKIA